MLDDPTPATAAAQPFDPLSAAPGWRMMASVEHHAKKRLNPGLFHNCNSRTKPRRQALIAAPAIRICAVRHRQNAGPRMTPADRHDAETYPDCVLRRERQMWKRWPLDRLDTPKKELGASPPGLRGPNDDQAATCLSRQI